MKETFSISVAAAVLSAVLMITVATFGLIDLVIPRYLALTFTICFI